MIKQFYLFILLLGLSTPAISQIDLKQMTTSIVKENLGLQALQLDFQMRDLENKQKLVLERPHLDYGYLWGSPEFIGIRKDFGVGQDFKFPTYYLRQRKANQLTSEIYHSETRLRINELATSVLEYFLELAFLQQKEQLLNQRLGNMKQLSGLVHDQLNAGATNRLESGKLDLLLEAGRQDLLSVQSDQELIRHKLIHLNGGKVVTVPELSLSDFNFLEEQIDQQSLQKMAPANQQANLQIELASVKQAMTREEWLPDLYLGYMSEAIPDEKFAGIKAGISIPLWGFGSRLKKSRLERELAFKYAEDVRQKLVTDLTIESAKAQRFKEIRDQLMAGMDEYGTQGVLMKSYRLGQISLKDYLLELPFYYQVEDRILEADKQYYQALLNRMKPLLSQTL